MLFEHAVLRIEEIVRSQIGKRGSRETVSVVRKLLDEPDDEDARKCRHPSRGGGDGLLTALTKTIFSTDVVTCR